MSTYMLGLCQIHTVSVCPLSGNILSSINMLFCCAKQKQLLGMWKMFFLFKCQCSIATYC